MKIGIHKIRLHLEVENSDFEQDIIIKSSIVFTVPSSFDCGERDSLGRPVGLTRVGSDL